MKVLESKMKIVLQGQVDVSNKKHFTKCENSWCIQVLGTVLGTVQGPWTWDISRVWSQEIHSRVWVDMATNVFKAKRVVFSSATSMALRSIAHSKNQNQVPSSQPSIYFIPSHYNDNWSSNCSGSSIRKKK